MTIKRLGGRADKPQPKILSQNPVSTQTEPQIRDSRTKTEPVIPTVVVHEEVVTTADKIRTQKNDPSEPEVRIRDSRGKKAFDQEVREGW